MKKIFNKISLLIAAGLVLVGMAACSDPDEPVTSVEFNKLFSPTELEAKVQNKTSVKLLWTTISKAESYTIELYADDPNMTFRVLRWLKSLPLTRLTTRAPLRSHTMSAAIPLTD